MRYAIMSAVSAALLMAAGCSDAPTEAQDETTVGEAEALSLEAFSGDWSGSLEVAGQSIPLVFHVDPSSEPPVTLDSPSQGAFDIPSTTSGVDGDEFFADFRSIFAGFRGTLSDDGSVLAGTFSQAGRKTPLELTRSAEGDDAPSETTRRARMQEPTGELPYAVEEVTIINEGLPNLEGTLTMPDGDGPFPGIILVSGSGPQDRDETLMGHKPFLVLADRLTREGIAVLRYDERGVGASDGDYGSSDLQDFTVDAIRAMDVLAARAEVGSVGILGHSEGGLISLIAASDEVPGTIPTEEFPAFIITLAGPYLAMDEVIESQVRYASERAGMPPAAVEQNVAIQRSLLDAAMEGDTPDEACAAIADVTAQFPVAVQAEAQKLCAPVAFSWFRTDIEALAEDLDVPALVLFGSKDTQVPAAAHAEAAKRLVGDKAEIIVVEDANHLFQSAQNGDLTEYGEIEETMNENVMAQIAAFVLDATSE